MTTSCIIGASAGLGRALAERLAANGHRLHLVASDQRDLSALAADLQIRYGRDVATLAVDIVAADPSAVCEHAFASVGPITNLLVVAGRTSIDDRPGCSDGELTDLLSANFLAPARIVNAFVPFLRHVPDANIVGMGSVAEIRGRRNNSAYASSKRGLEFYFESLRHDLADTSCRVQFFRLGYLATSMTFAQKLMLPAISAEQAASAVTGAFGRDIPAKYLPSWWRFAEILKLVPWSIYSRLTF